jgi:hypothetical protein
MHQVKGCNMSVLKFLLLIIFFLSSTDLFAQRFIEYEKGKEIIIKVGYSSKDLSIDFREKFILGAPIDFKVYFRPQIIDSVLYLKVIKKTKKQFRVLIKSEKTTFILNVQQSKEGDNEAVIITKATKESVNNSFSKKRQLSDVELVRFISQKLYAPKFAQEPLMGLQIVPHNLPDDLDWLYQGGGVNLSPIVSFRAGDKYVTAIKVKNKSQLRAVNLNMDNLFNRVGATSATPQHRRIGFKDEDNVTALYLVTNGSLVENIKIKGFL